MSFWNKPIGFQWAYGVKFNLDHIIEVFKARLMTKGYIQAYEIDYTEIFASVTKITTIWVLLSLTINLD